MSNAESIINYASSLFEGEVAMAFTADVSYVQVQQAPATISVAMQTGDAKPITIVDDCREVGNDEVYAESAYNNFVVGGVVFTSLGYKYNGNTGDFDLPEQVRTTFKMYVITPPTHGAAYLTTSDKDNMLYSYRAKEGYVGKDSFVIGVDTLTRSGKKIHFNLKFKLSVVSNITNEYERSTCVGLKFSSTPDAPMSISWDLPLPVSFSALAAGDVGQPVGVDASITLDPAAASSGWFIDPRFNIL